MNRTTAISMAAILMLGVAAVRSQMTSSGVPKSPLQILTTMKATNADLLDKQKKTLEALDELQKTADQLKTFGKRS